MKGSQRSRHMRDLVGRANTKVEKRLSAAEEVSNMSSVLSELLLLIEQSSEANSNDVESAFGDTKILLLKILKALESKPSKDEIGQNGKSLSYRFTVRRDKQGLIEELRAEPY